MNPKQEAIKKAWGKYWETIKDKIDDDGVYKGPIYFMEESERKNFIVFMYLEGNAMMQPKGIRGIETNNGWTNYQNTDPLPDPGDYWVEALDGTIMTLIVYSPGEPGALETATFFNQYVVAYQRLNIPARRIY